MILVFGTDEDDVAKHILGKLEERNAEVMYFDSRRFPSELKLTYKPGVSMAEYGFLEDPDYNLKLPLREITSIYCRQYMGIEVDPSEPDAYVRDFMWIETNSAMGSWFRNMDHCLWVNNPVSGGLHRYKAHQLHIVRNLGFRIPDTLITNDPDEVKAFYHQHNGKLIYKPVLTGAHTVVMSEEDLAPEKLEELKKAPVTFQEFIPGKDIRVHIVHDQFFVSEVETDVVDYRKDKHSPMKAIKLPDEIEAQCLEIARALGLVLTGIDIRRTNDGEYVFLEANPSPVFTYFEDRTEGIDVSGALVDLLIAGKKKADNLHPFETYQTSFRNLEMVHI